jgi:hypothetical protein
MEGTTMSGSERLREAIERRTGMPAYLADDETIAAAEAEIAANPPADPKPLHPLADAVRRARSIDPVAFINAFNAGRRADGETEGPARAHDGGDNERNSDA